MFYSSCFKIQEMISEYKKKSVKNLLVFVMGLVMSANTTVKQLSSRMQGSDTVSLIYLYGINENLTDMM